MKRTTKKNAPQSDYIEYVTLSDQEIAKSLDTSLSEGLSAQEVQKRLATFGLNALESGEKPLSELIKRQINTPFFYLFFGTCILYFIIGEFSDGIIILIIMCINFALTFYQEYRASHNIELLKKYIVSHVDVIRSGKQIEVESSQLVPGDIIILNAGDNIPADCRFLQTDQVAVDESALTGESVTVEKNADAQTQKPNDIFTTPNIGFAGTAMQKGSATAVVFATGTQTQFAHIASTAKQAIRQTALSTGTEQLASFILKMVIIVIVAALLFHIFIQHAHTSITEVIIFATALAVSVIPEALPLVTTLCLSQGALALAKRGVIVKRLSAIEDLGSIDVLCTDKTGTLTENIMQVTDTYPNTSRDMLMAMGCALAPTIAMYTKTKKGFESAVWHTLEKKEQDALLHAQLIKHAPFDPTIKRTIHLVTFQNNTLLITYGAPESIFEICAQPFKKNGDEHAWIMQEEQKGNRVLAIAQKVMTKAPEALDKEKDYEFKGLIAFADPIKKTAAAAIAHARKLGIQIKIISGDSPYICHTVASQLGLIKESDEVLIGADFEAQSPNERAKSAEKYTVFARFSPEQKCDLISFLEKQYSVGYVGDGINDAPALKLANASLSVDKAVDVARDAADIILLEKSLSVIVNGIQEGRIIFANTLKYITIVLVSNTGNLFAIIAALLYLGYIPLLPIQILLINLIADFPMIVIATDNVSRDDVHDIPRYDTHELARAAFILGAFSIIFDCCIFLLFKDKPIALFRSCWFILCVLSELVIIFSLRSKQLFFHATRPSWLLIILSLLAAIVTIALPFTTIGQRSLQLVPVPLPYLLIIGGLAITYFFTNEWVKLWVYGHKKTMRKKRA